ncbi:hypothetical protein [Methanobrevibacter sp.]|uniref:hypothetical protein n=1 Tax=Methanobrevibacter sp. TaxID=66852 RepID=UPI0025E6A399|nr:hypothetical protein [Methanobrevibacter sp.]MBQ2666752.1 hypothetical protein [Methanobrevibacter sp.]
MLELVIAIEILIFSIFLKQSFLIENNSLISKISNATGIPSSLKSKIMPSSSSNYSL